MTTKPRRPGPGKRFGPAPLPPEKKRVKVSTTLPLWVAEWLWDQDQRTSTVVEAALIGYYDLKKPEEKEK